MFKSTKRFLLALSVILSVSYLNAQVGINKVGQTSMKFLSVTVGARSAAMGDACMAFANDADAVFSNPAGITMVTHQFSFSAGYNKWIAGIIHNYGSFLYNAGDLGVFGLNMIWVDYGEVEGTRRSSIDPRGYVETGVIRPNAFAIGLAYGRSISSQFSFGVNIKFVDQNLGTGYIGTGTTTEGFKTVKNEMGLFAFDFGTIYNTRFKNLKLVMSVSNISQERSFIRESAPLPLLLKFGMAMDVMKLFSTENDLHKLNIEIDALHPRDHTERMNFGMEYVFKDFFSLRAGYKTNYDEDNISFGFGLQPSIAGFDANLDYALNLFGRFDTVQRISFGLLF